MANKMPPIRVEEVRHLTRSDNTRKGFVIPLISKLEHSCTADPFDSPGRVDALTMDLELAENTSLAWWKCKDSLWQTLNNTSRQHSIWEALSFPRTVIKAVRAWSSTELLVLQLEALLVPTFQKARGEQLGQNSGTRPNRQWCSRDNIARICAKLTSTLRKSEGERERWRRFGSVLLKTRSRSRTSWFDLG